MTKYTLTGSFNLFKEVVHFI